MDDMQRIWEFAAWFRTHSVNFRCTMDLEDIFIHNMVDSYGLDFSLCGMDHCIINARTDPIYVKQDPHSWLLQ